MPASVTDSDIRSNQEGHGSDPEQAPVRTRARARIANTESNSKIRIRLSELAAGIGPIARRWWVYSDRPPSLAATWRATAIDESRVLNGSRRLRGLWRLSNATDRLLFFALLFLAPTGLQGPLRWLLQRPTRRAGTYVFLAAMAATYATARQLRR